MEDTGNGGQFQGCGIFAGPLGATDDEGLANHRHRAPRIPELAMALVLIGAVRRIGRSRGISHAHLVGDLLSLLAGRMGGRA